MTARTERGLLPPDEISPRAVSSLPRGPLHTTGMDDIGAEAGISGPAIYRLQGRRSW